MAGTATTLELVIGFSPGSASDDIANLIAAPLGAQLGRKVSIRRIAGESGTLGAHAAAASAADGSTLFIATLGTHALAPHVRRAHSNLSYHPLEDFVAVSLLTQSPMLLACHPALPVRTVSELIEHARAHPSALAYGTSAIGGAPHLAAELFQSVAGVQLRHARFDDTRQLYADLVAGRIDLSFNNIKSMLPRCASGELRALAITAAQRVAIAPDVPTLADCGLRNCEVSNWLGLVAPRGTPADVVSRIADAAAAVMNSRAIADALNAAGITPCGSTPAVFAEFMASELKRWGPIAARFAEV